MSNENSPKSSSMGVGAVWALLLAIFGGAAVYSGATSAPSTSTTASPVLNPTNKITNDKSAPTTVSRLQRPLTDYFGLPAYIQPPSTVRLDISSAGVSNTYQLSLPGQMGSGHAKGIETQLRADLMARIKLEVCSLSFFIATVADPRDSQAGYRFDFQLDTLHRAFGAEGFSLARFYLPWDDNSDLHRREPGVLLYRRSAPQPSETPDGVDFLVVYLVGETPTAGIHKQAFGEAIEQAHALQQLGGIAKNTVSICGPTFTGSADSLATSLRDSNSPDGAFASTSPLLAFNVITGSATNVDPLRFERLSKVPITSTLAHGNAMKKALINHVVARSWSRVKIAWLSETTSGFGVVSLNTPGTNTQAEVVEFPFPLNLAGVRATYEEQRRRERAGESPLGRERFGLPISFNDGSAFRDVPPMQTPLVTAPSHEIILGQIVNTIRNENIQYVGISATDARDPIFLAQVIREQCPNVQIMIVAADYLHLNSEHRKVLHGALVASTYSLYPEEQHWCYPFGHPNSTTSVYQVLSNESYIGIYNAATFLRRLQSGPAILPSSNTVDGKHRVASIWIPANDDTLLPLAYGAPFQDFGTIGNATLVPPIWISRIGPVAIYPVAAMDNSDSDYTLHLEIKSANAAAKHPLYEGRVLLSSWFPMFLWISAAAVYAFPLPIRYPAWINLVTQVASGANAATPVSEHQYENALQYVFCATIGCALSITSGEALLIAVGEVLLIEVHTLPGILRVVWASICVLVFSATLLRTFMMFRRALPLLARAPSEHLSTGPERLRTKWMRRAGIISFVIASVISLAVIIIASWQLIAWWLEPSRRSFKLWFNFTIDEWNGLSSLACTHFVCATIIMLAYSMMRQIDLLSRDNCIPPPLRHPVAIGSAERQRTTRMYLLFPILSRQIANDKLNPIDLLLAVLPSAWLLILYLESNVTDYFAWPGDLKCGVFLIACAYWIFRLRKFFTILRIFKAWLKDTEMELQCTTPRSEWADLFKAHASQSGLQELLWSTSARPEWSPAKFNDEKNRLESASKTLFSGKHAFDEVYQQLFAWEIDLYVRQAFKHLVTIAVCLIASGFLLFITANSYPFRGEPLYRATAAVMLIAVSAISMCYYIMFDRNELLSRITGTEPHRIAWDLTLLQYNVVPLLFIVIAVFSQTSPEMWQWLRDLSEPMIPRSK